MDRDKNRLDVDYRYLYYIDYSWCYWIKYIMEIELTENKNKVVIEAIKFCLNWNPLSMELYSVDYKTDKELYKCELLDRDFGGWVEVRLNEKFVRSGINWLKNGGLSSWMS